MTFKHVKFEDSPIMRSLEKVAKEKGLVKPETFQKQASIEKKADYTPSDNLMENILKLCSGLRSKGLVKEATELEKNYLDYKCAQTLYETSKETGEDLVQSAHPKGSHKLEGVEGDEATFEDILDAHVKHLEMVAKKPTGKLSNAGQILKEVKRVLGQQQSAQQLLQAASALVNQAIAIAGKGGGLSSPVLNWATGRASKVSTIAAKTDQDLTINDATDAEDVINAIARNLHPSLLHNYLPEFMTKGISSDDVWEKISGLLDNAIQKVKVAEGVIKSSALSGGVADQPGPSQTVQLNEITIKDGPLGPLYKRLGTLKQKLKSYNLLGPIANNAAARQWIKEELSAIENLLNRVDQVPENMEAEMVQQFVPEVTDLEADVADFASQWTQSK